MKRRKFFKTAAPIAASSLMLSSNPLSPLFKTQLLNDMTCDGINDRILIVVNLSGGNDGINTLVPIEQYDQYASMRPTLALPNTGNNAIIPLDTNLPLANQVGLHPQLSSLKDLYDAGKVNVIQGTGYNGGMNGSHFKGTDIWHTGGDGTSQNVNKNSGWMGRYLEYVYSGNFGNPNDIMPDPPALSFGGRVSLGYRGLSQDMGAFIPYDYYTHYHRYKSANGINNPAVFPDTVYGRKLLYMANIQGSNDVYSISLVLHLTTKRLQEQEILRICIENWMNLLI